MQLGKLSLINLLMEEGEEDSAVLLAGSDLPDTLDTDRDLPALRALGIDEDDLRTLLPAVTGGPDRGPGLSADAAAALDRTISERWAALVAGWTGART
ncbi:hypothetical protein SAMN04489712_13928 [Thermomonospora echinospora]|uniref:Uncharacterized protein n=1 Tax=Thermomonospora echinospora TaxID=1992 RepID=A0A1H6E732_9ACTN|nr:hypothetical protein [Thermomonospora echinospora]SEG93550.1 hypothetical protein SAMN04489712_13928 [Thermomonospora echinospora]